MPNGQIGKGREKSDFEILERLRCFDLEWGGSLGALRTVPNWVQARDKALAGVWLTE